MEANIARDKHARVCSQISQLVESLRPGREVSALIPICDQIYDLLEENHDLKSQVITSHGLFPILELLDTYEEARLNLRLLRILNIIIMDDIEIQESLCFMGGIPIVTKFAFKPFASNIRHEAAAFFQQICQTSTLTMQIFVSCRGLNVIAQILDEDYRSEKDLVLVGVGAIWNVFNLHWPPSPRSARPAAAHSAGTASARSRRPPGPGTGPARRRWPAHGGCSFSPLATTGAV